MRAALDHPHKITRLVLLASTPKFVATADWERGMAMADLADFGAATNLAADSALLNAVESGEVDSLFSRTLVAERDYNKARAVWRAGGDQDGRAIAGLERRRVARRRRRSRGARRDERRV